MVPTSSSSASWKHSVVVVGVVLDIVGLGISVGRKLRGEVMGTLIRNYHHPMLAIPPLHRRLP